MENYRGRVVVLANYEGIPAVGFILASRSEQEREIRANQEKGRIDVVATGLLEEKIAGASQFPWDYANDIYSCVLSFCCKDGQKGIVAFNGRAGRRIKDMMESGRNYFPEACLEKTLEVFPPKVANDPRLGAVVFIGKDCPEFYFGTFGLEDEKPIIMKLDGLGEKNKAKFIALSSPSAIGEISLDAAQSPDELAQQIFYRVLGNSPIFGIGSGVCMLRGGEFQFGKYNRQVKEQS